MGIYTQPFEERFKYPIAICDGMYIGEPEEFLIHVFEMEKIPFTLEEKLYGRDDYDLSQYKTIAFGTFDDSGPRLSKQMEKIFSFDKKNLELVIVLNWNAFIKVKDTVQQLHLDCLGFRPHKFEFFDPFETPPSQRYW